MQGFNKGKKYGGGSGGNDRSGNRKYGGGKFEHRTMMHKTVCAKCGNSCEVPFKPTGNKAIFCSTCFKGKDHFGSSDSRSEGRGKFGDRNSKPRFENKKPYRDEREKSGANYHAQFEILNAKLDKILRTITPSVTPEKIEFETPIKIVEDGAKKATAKKAGKKATAKKKKK